METMALFNTIERVGTVVVITIVAAVVLAYALKRLRAKYRLSPNRKHLPENSDIKRWGPPDDSIDGDW